MIQPPTYSLNRVLCLASLYASIPRFGGRSTCSGQNYMDPATHFFLTEFDRLALTNLRCGTP